MTVTSFDGVCNAPPGACRTSVDIADLLYIAGVDASLCDKFMSIADVFSLRDCANQVISSTTPIVTCADFRAQLCAALALFDEAGDITFGTTKLVGSDCQLYTVPETPVTVVDSPSINLSSSGSFGHTLRADSRISADGGNSLSVHTDGLYAPTANICTMLASLGVGSPSVPNISSFVGPDCLIHVQSETFINPTDSLTIGFTVNGTSDHDITAVVIVDPDADNLVEVTADGLMVSCTAVNACIDICTPLALRPLAGPADGTTELIGKDCNAYTIPVPFTFTSPIAVNHTIVHNLGNLYPSVTVYNTGTGQVIIPATITSVDANTLDITFFGATAIAGTIVG